MKPLKIILAASQQEEYVRGPSDYIRVQECGPGMAVVIELPETGESVALQEGDDAVLTQFTRLRVSHTAATEKTITLLIGKGTRATSSKVGGSVVSVPSVANTLASIPDVTLTAAAVTPIEAEDSGRREIIITALPGNTADIRIGDNAISAARGLLLAPGQAVTLDTTAAVFGFAAVAGQSVSILEVRHV